VSHQRAYVESAVNEALARLVPGEGALRATIERPKQVQHGDYATNAALQHGKRLGRNPREFAQALADLLRAVEGFEAVEVAGPGFLNIRLVPEVRWRVVHDVLALGSAYGRGSAGAGRRVMVEFVSANPTGPLHVGHGRGAAVGDSLASLLAHQGWDVCREFYYNDAGAQIENLVLSVRARVRQQADPSHPMPEDGYLGEYIREIARDYVANHGNDPNAEDSDAVRAFAVAEMRAEQDRDLLGFGVRFDSYYLESSLHADGRVGRVVDRLVANEMTYERDGALWLRTTDFGDDKDRVMVKSDGSYTYFVPDVAYHVTKWERGFARVVNEQGADHHSTVTRVRAGLQALRMGIPEGYPEYVLHQMVTVMRGGEEVKLSKRAGTYVTVRDLVDEVGRDAVRFFFLLRKSDSQLTFDIDLARSQSEENPVYYVQYAHARIASVLRQAGVQTADLSGVDLSPLASPYEEALLRRLADFPVMLAEAARELAPHQIPFYLRELAGEFHSYYNAEQFLVQNAALRASRLALISAVAQVIRNGLAVIGVSAPEQM
jgi:arginyl-tRNA synthetase